MTTSKEKEEALLAHMIAMLKAKETRSEQEIIEDTRRKAAMLEQKISEVFSPKAIERLVNLTPEEIQQIVDARMPSTSAPFEDTKGDDMKGKGKPIIVQPKRSWRCYDDAEQASVYDDQHKKIAGPIEDRDAFLIAAAPELLAACEELLSIPQIALEAAGSVKRARAAVRKAKGETT